MDVLTELVAKISADATELKKGLSDAEGKTEASSKRMADSLKKVGMAMAASGAAITAAMGLMGKAAIDEDINIKRLATTINNSGTAYDNVKDSLEALIATTQRKTGIADNEQRDVLNRLILVTNDYNKALELLPTALDLAAAGEMDAATAATYLGKAYLDLENGADKVSVRFGQASLQFNSMEDIQNRVAGSAEALANPLDILKATIGDVAESIGKNLIPMIKGAVDKIVDIAVKVQEWIAANPALARTLTVVALAVGVVLTILGGLILIIPVITSHVAAFGIVMHAALGPIGLISIAITALIAIGVLLWKNWDTVKIIFLKAVGAMLGGLVKFLGWMPGLGDKLREAKEAISNMIDAKEIEKSARAMTETIRTELEKQKSDALNALNDKKRMAKDGYDAAVKAIKEEYGEFKTATKNKQDLARDDHDTRMRLLEDEYDQRIRTLNAETNAQVSAIQQQIDTIDRQTKQEDLALTRAAEQKKLRELRATGTAEELAEYETEVRRNELLRQRDDERDSLRAEIDAIRDNARQQENILRANLETQKTALDTALENELQRLKEEGIAKQGLEKLKLDAALATITSEEMAIKASFELRLTEAAIYQSALEAMLRDVSQTVTTNYVSTYSGGGAITAPASSGGGVSAAPTTAAGWAGLGVEYYQSGGRVSDTGLAYLHEGETVIPAGEGAGGITVNISGPLFMEREDQMNQLVDKIRKGIQRSDRLRFGGAYQGG